MLCDFHATGAGYIASPIDGSLCDVVSIATMMADPVLPLRRLGVSVEYAAWAKAQGCQHLWGGAWIDEKPSGLRNTIPAEVSEAVISGMARLGMRIMCVGSTCGGEDLRRLLAVARDTGLSVAIEPHPSTLDTLPSLPSGSSIESLRVAAVAIGARHGYRVGSAPANAQRTLLELGELPCGADEVIARELIAWGIPLTPLMASTRVQADLAALTSAPGLDELSRIMPHHARILRLRAPGGMAMGQREAMKHLGMVPLSKCDREVLAKGWALLRSVLGLVASSTWLVGGSGAPGLGMHPRYALDEEQRIWRDCGIPENHIRRSFGDETASLLGIRRNA